MSPAMHVAGENSAEHLHSAGGAAVVRAGGSQNVAAGQQSTQQDVEVIQC